MTKNSLSKDNILEKTNNGFDIFKHYINDFTEIGKPFCSPLRADNNPSTNIFQNESGEYLYKDFAEENALNAFDFVMKLKTLNGFYKVLHAINQDLKLGLVSESDKIDFEEGTDFNYWYQFSNDNALIDTILAKYQVKSLKKFKTNTGFEVRDTFKNPAFAFKITENAYKIYKPLEQNRKFKHFWLGKKPIDYKNVFGIEQLPEHCRVILITEGLKDSIVANSNLNENDIFAVALDNVSTSIPIEIIDLLKLRCEYLVLCLDIDEKGIEGSTKKSKKYGLRNFILPQILKEKEGKDISDWFKLKMDKQLLLDELEKVLASPEPPISKERIIEDPILDTLLKMEELVKQRASKEIVSALPIVEREGVGILRKGTICSIQGKFGTHKSRLAEGFCSLMIDGSIFNDFVGFRKNSDELFTVCYIDTERNREEEFPLCIQSILKKSGVSESSSFRFTSIKHLKRNQRLKGLKTFLNEVRKGTNNHLFVVLDVLTDCISNFNDPTESMELYDYLGNLAENENATFLLIIHENPNSDKARGHLGTEGANKASTVFSIGFETNRSNQETDLIRLKFIKLRSAKKPDNVYLKYSDTVKGLILAPQIEVACALNDRRNRADKDEVLDHLTELMNENREYSQKEITDALVSKFNCSINTIKDRLKEIETSQSEISNLEGCPCYLESHSVNGKQTMYKLAAIPAEQLEIF